MRPGESPPSRRRPALFQRPRAVCRWLPSLQSILLCTVWHNNRRPPVGNGLRAKCFVRHNAVHRERYSDGPLFGPRTSANSRAAPFIAAYLPPLAQYVT
jgi:hypothetical protein